MTRPSPCGGRTRAGRRRARSGARRSPTWCASRRRGRFASSCCSATSTSPISGSVPTAADAGANSTAPTVPISTGCVDIHLACTPFSATLPIRRSRLEIGESMSVTVATVDVETLGVVPVEHAYSRSSLRGWQHVDESGVTGRLRRRRVRPRHRSPRPLPPPLSRSNQALGVSPRRTCQTAEGGEELLEGCGVLGVLQCEFDRRREEAERRPGVVAALGRHDGVER